MGNPGLNNRQSDEEIFRSSKMGAKTFFGTNKKPMTFIRLKNGSKTFFAYNLSQNLAEANFDRCLTCWAQCWWWKLLHDCPCHLHPHPTHVSKTRLSLNSCRKMNREISFRGSPLWIPNVDLQIFLMLPWTNLLWFVINFWYAWRWLKRNDISGMWWYHKYH